MPKKGFKAVTISEDVYRLAEEIVKKYKRRLDEKRIRSITQLIEDAVIYYTKDVLKEENIIKKLEKQAKTEWEVEV